MKSKKAKWVFGIALASIPLAPITYMLVYDWQTSKRQEAAFAKLKALGYPTNLEEYRQTAPDIKKNAAPLLRDLAREWKDLFGSESLDSSTSPTPEMVGLVKKHQPFLVKASALRNYQDIWVDRDYSDGWSPSLDHAALKSVGRFLALAAQVDWDEGRIEEALDKYETAYHLQDLLAREGSIVGVLVGMSLKSFLDRTLTMQAITFSSLNERQRLRKLMASHPLRVDPRSLVASEVLAAQQKWPDDIFGPLSEIMPPSEFDRRVSKIEALRRRAKTAALEEIAHLAELVKDGRFDRLDASHLTTETKKHVDREILARRLCLHATGHYYNAFTAEVLEGKEAQDLALIDLLIEQAGGPVAVAKPGATILRKPGRTEIHGIKERAIYILSGNTFTSERRP